MIVCIQYRLSFAIVFNDDFNVFIVFVHYCIFYRVWFGWQKPCNKKNRKHNTASPGSICWCYTGNHDNGASDLWTLTAYFPACAAPESTTLYPINNSISHIFVLISCQIIKLNRLSLSIYHNGYQRNIITSRQLDSKFMSFFFVRRMFLSDKAKACHTFLIENPENAPFGFLRHTINKSNTQFKHKNKNLSFNTYT